MCPAVDGGWSQYGAWSACDVTCRQSRQRSCSAPAPARGGRPCSGADREHRNCSKPDCQGKQSPLRTPSDIMQPFYIAGYCPPLPVFEGGGIKCSRLFPKPLSFLYFPNKRHEIPWEYPLKTVQGTTLNCLNSCHRCHLWEV